MDKALTGNSQNEKTLQAIRCHFSSTCDWYYLTVTAGNGACCTKSRADFVPVSSRTASKSEIIK